MESVKLNFRFNLNRLKKFKSILNEITLVRLQLESSLWWNTGLSFLIRTILDRRPLATLAPAGTE
jgi:hypothetical protein